MSGTSDRGLSQDLERELAALADGSLPDEHRHQALGRVRDSQQLQEELATQEQAVQMLATADAIAPSDLHERIGAMAATATLPDEPSKTATAWRRRMRSRHRHPRLSIAFAGVTLLAGAAGIALALSGSGQKPHLQGSPALTASSTVTLALSPATLPAPSESKSNHAQLTAAVGDLAFPYWKERFGWRGSGARSDTLGGRAVVTVFYSNPAGQRIGYAIVAGPAPATGDGSVVRRWGVSYRLSMYDGANVIVWRRDGHLCVMAGHGVSQHTLLNLASWDSERPHVA